ncbi:unnamed protein product [Gongylonema pulchrum]|uniref:Uncharacterized protein n=1 Tax=Gongylonema pulchrum TaxID=637853 RepID=A0A3P6RDM0_9BILA|nr:unnamed protein product [Gongylonema pulchrum]
MYSNFEFFHFFLQNQTWIFSGESCISTAPRAFSPGASVQQFNAIPAPQGAAVPPPQGVALVAGPQQAAGADSAAGGIVRPALSAAGRGPTEAIPQQQLIESKFYLYLPVIQQFLFLENLVGTEFAKMSDQRSIK